jgi:transcriptional regulator with XRE-family HTH domain/DNA-directed RNA polymerase specialized sigma24 family protein
MKFSKEFIAKAVSGSRLEAAALAPVIRKCAAAGASKSKTQAAPDDVEQELWIFLLRNHERLDEEYNIEPYLIDTARNIALSLNRRFAMFGTFGSEDTRPDGLVNMMGGEVSSAEEAISGLIDRTAQQQALDELMRMSPGLRAAANEVEDAPGEDDMLKKKPKAAKTAAKSAAKPSTPGPEHRELRRIRMDNHLTQAEMAAKIGCKLPTYQAYEYGKTETVNPAVMEAARKIKENKDFSYIAQLYKRKTMSQIARAWCDRLKIPTGNVSALARVVGVDKSTVSRWMKPMSEVEPDMERMATYERRVNAEERWLKQQEARHRGAKALS